MVGFDIFLLLGCIFLIGILGRQKSVSRTWLRVVAGLALALAAAVVFLHEIALLRSEVLSAHSGEIFVSLLFLLAVSVLAKSWPLSQRNYISVRMSGGLLAVALTILGLVTVTNSEEPASFWPRVFWCVLLVSCAIEFVISASRAVMLRIGNIEWSTKLAWFALSLCGLSVWGWLSSDQADVNTNAAIYATPVLDVLYAAAIALSLILANRADLQSRRRYLIPIALAGLLPIILSVEGFLLGQNSLANWLQNLQPEMRAGSFFGIAHAPVFSIIGCLLLLSSRRHRAFSLITWACGLVVTLIGLVSIATCAIGELSDWQLSHSSPISLWAAMIFTLLGGALYLRGQAETSERSWTDSLLPVLATGIVIVGSCLAWAYMSHQREDLIRNQTLAQVDQLKSDIELTLNFLSKSHEYEAARLAILQPPHLEKQIHEQMFVAFRFSPALQWRSVLDMRGGVVYQQFRPVLPSSLAQILSERQQWLEIIAAGMHFEQPRAVFFTPSSKYWPLILVTAPLRLENSSEDYILASLLRPDLVVGPVVRSNANASDYQIHLFDDRQNSIYSNSNEQMATHDAIQSNLQFGGLNWVIRVAPSATWVNAARSSVPEWIFVLGVLIAGMVAINLHLMTIARDRAVIAEKNALKLLAQQKEREAIRIKLKQLNRDAIAVNSQIEGENWLSSIVNGARITLEVRFAALFEIGAEAESINSLSLACSSIEEADSALYNKHGHNLSAMLLEDWKKIFEFDSLVTWDFGQKQSLFYRAQGNVFNSVLLVELRSKGGGRTGILCVADKLSGEFSDDDEFIAVQYAQMAKVVLQRRNLLEDRRIARQSLSEQVEFFNTISSSVGDGIVALNKQGLVSYANLAAANMLAFDEKDLINKDFFAEFVVNVVSEAAGNNNSQFESLEVLDLNSQRPIDVIFRTGKGATFEASYVAWPLRHGDMITGAVIVFRDATEHRKAQLALRERDRFFELSDELMCITDAQFLFKHVNRAFCRVLGYSKDDLLQRSYESVLSADDSKMHLDRFAEIDVGESIRLVCRVSHADGTLIDVEWTWMKVEHGACFALGRDISERINSERQMTSLVRDLRYKNRELRDFAFVASHDLQEPLRKIQTFGERVLEENSGNFSEKSKGYLDRMFDAAGRMRALIDGLLEYSRVASQLKTFKKCNLNEMLAEAVSDLEASIEQSDAKVISTPLPIVDGDPIQLRQVLQNIISNAIKFRDPSRQIVVEVKGKVVSIHDSIRNLERDFCQLTISDNGIGIDPQYHTQIFAPFQRLHSRAEYAGTGIGLSIVRKIVQRHGGTISASGKVGRGTLFTIMLPLKYDEASTISLFPEDSTVLSVEKKVPDLGAKALT